MLIYIAVGFVLTGGISIFSLCKVAGRSDKIEEELLNRDEYQYFQNKRK